MDDQDIMLSESTFEAESEPTLDPDLELALLEPDSEPTLDPAPSDSPEIVEEIKEIPIDDEPKTEPEAESSEAMDAEVKSLDAEATKTVDEAKTKDETHDPFFYTNQQDLFTSEIYKIELKNLPKFFGLGELRKLLSETLKLDANKVKPATKRSVFVCFRSQAAKMQGIQVLNGYRWKGTQFFTAEARPAKDPLMLKRKKMAAESGGGAKVPKFATQEELVKDCIEQLNDSVTPYWRKTYEEQLKQKMHNLLCSVKAYSKGMVSVNPMLSRWVSRQRLHNKGLVCPVEPFKTAEKIDNYRNRCEFTIGTNAATKEPCVGFRLGAYNMGDCSVFPADACVHVPDVAKKCATVFSQFVAASEFRPFDPVQRCGQFKTLDVRTSNTGQLMITLDFYTTGLEVDQVANFKKDLKEFFVTGAGAELEVTSLNFKALNIQTQRQDMHRAPELIHGEAFIVQELLGLKFNMSPTAFFQVNTPGAELLYSAIAELAAPDQFTTVLDICCGTGTIGISMAKDAGQILGIEIDASAIENAKKNAEINGLKDKCDFFAGNAATFLQPTIVRAKHDNIVAILDPPRAGVMTPVLNTLRSTWKINRLVFVACSFESSYKNLVHLARSTSKQTPGDPFLPVKIVPVDLFPHTSHYEVIIYLERRAPSFYEIAKAIKDPEDAVEGEMKDGDEEEEKGGEEGSDLKKEGETKVASPEKKGDATEKKSEAAGKKDDKKASGNKLTGPLVKVTALGKKRRKLLQTAIKTVYAKELEFEDIKQVDPKNIVQLFAFSVTPEEFNQMKDTNLFRKNYAPSTSARKGHPTPKMLRKAKYCPNMRPAPFQTTPFNARPYMEVRNPWLHQQGAPRMSFGTQTDCSQFLSKEELENAEDLGFTWGGRVADGVLHDLVSLQREEEEAVLKFREGFLSALKLKQRKLIHTYVKDKPAAPDTYEERDNFGREPVNHGYQPDRGYDRFRGHSTYNDYNRAESSGMRGDDGQFGSQMRNESYGSKVQFAGQNSRQERRGWNQNVLFPAGNSSAPPAPKISPWSNSDAGQSYGYPGHQNKYTWP